MNSAGATIGRIKNLTVRERETDFSYNAFSFLVLALFIGAGAAMQTLLGVSIPPTELAVAAAIVLSVGGFLRLMPQWGVLVQFVAVLAIATVAWNGGTLWILALVSGVGIVFSAAFHIVYQWDKVVVLRLGRFKAVHGPGLFLLFPLVDRVAAHVDTRIRVTDFSAEKTITSDTVPVHVDALAFWMIWDARKAVLEVERYLEAVSLSAQTALRDSIGKHDLATLLSERDRMGEEIRAILEAKMNDWGITILSIEFTDIIIPKELEDAMSKKAQAEREYQSRVILSSAEVEVAQKFRDAAEIYGENEAALHLRAMNMVYEGIRNKNNSMMILPASALESMNLGTALGLQALKNVREHTAEADASQDDDASHEGGTR